MTEGLLIWGLLFSAIGLGYAVYGRKQRAITPFIAGLSLIGLPYFVPDTSWLIGIGILLLVAPFFIKA